MARPDVGCRGSVRVGARRTPGGDGGRATDSGRRRRASTSARPRSRGRAAGPRGVFSSRRARIGRLRLRQGPAHVYFPQPSASPITPSSGHRKSTRATSRRRSSRIDDLGIRHWQPEPVKRHGGAGLQPALPTPVDEPCAGRAAAGVRPTALATARILSTPAASTPARRAASAIGTLISAGKCRRQSATVRLGAGHGRCRRPADRWSAGKRGDLADHAVRRRVGASLREQR